MKKLFLTTLCFFLLVGVAFGDGSITYPLFQAFDSDGNLLVGGQLYAWEPETSTAKTTYSDKSLTTANEQPVELDSRGEAAVYVSGSTDFVLYDIDGVLVKSFDAIEGQLFFEPVSYLSNYDSLAAAVLAISATEVELWLNADGNSTTTVPKNIAVRPTIGFVQSGAVAFNGPVIGEPMFQWLSGPDHTFGDSSHTPQIKRTLPEWWGADNDGTNAATTRDAFQWAIDAWGDGSSSTSYGGSNEVYLAGAYYKIDEALNPRYWGMVIRSASQSQFAAKIETVTSGFTGAAVFRHVHNTTYDDGDVVKDISIKHLAIMIRQAGLIGIWFENNYTHTADWSDGGVINSEIDHVYIDAVGNTAGSTGILWRGTWGHQVLNCRITNIAKGIDTERPDAAGANNGMQIIGNTIAACSTGGIFMDQALGPNITGNIIESGTTYGIQLHNFCRGVSIRGNYFEGNASDIYSTALTGLGLDISGNFSAKGDNQYFMHLTTTSYLIGEVSNNGIAYGGSTLPQDVGSSKYKVVFLDAGAGSSIRLAFNDNSVETDTGALLGESFVWSPDHYAGFETVVKGANQLIESGVGGIAIRGAATDYNFPNTLQNGAIFFDSVADVITLKSGGVEKDFYPTVGPTIQRLGSAGILTKDGDPKTTVYTVPAGKTAIIVQVIIRGPTVSLAGGSDFDIGSGVNATSWRQTINLSSMTATTDYMVIPNISSTPVKYTMEAAGATFGIKPVTGATLDGSATMDVYGYEF